MGKLKSFAPDHLVGVCEDMDRPGSCRKCGSNSVDKSRLQSVAEFSLNVFGLQPFRCADCDFRWKQWLPLRVLLSAIYLLLAAEIGFLLLSCLRF